MDPIAHTLVGASLAQTPLKRLSAWATPTLILAANAPDIDAVTILVDRDVSLGFRRGWTHGVLALVILPLALVGLMLLVDRILARRRRAPPARRAGPLIALSYIGVLTHPALDWLNTYGVRLLMPFDGRWFYGDALFIIDPWVWLLAGVAVVLAHARTVSAMSAWIALGFVLSVLVTAVGLVPPPARLLWIAGVAAIVGVRAWGGVRGRLPRLATLCLISAAVYIAAMVGGSRVAERQVTEWLAQRGTVPVEIMAGPLPANPFARDIVVADRQHYHFLELNWLRAEHIRIAGPAVDRGPNGPIVEAAVQAQHVQGVMTWARFPAFTVEERPDGGYRVTIRDVRYARLGGAGLGDAVVDLDRDLRVRPLVP